MKYVGLAIAIFFVIAIILQLFNRWLPVWFCKNADWHLEPKEKEFDGCSFSGSCPRCKKHVLGDSQGGWS